MRKTVPTPHLCTGFNVESKDWELVGPIAARTQEQTCPRGYGYMRVGFPTGSLRPGERIPIRGTCCPLPDGVLTDEHVWESLRCPENFVATGARAERHVTYEGDNWRPAILAWEQMTHYIRCTKIDTTRFSLSPPVETLTLGFHRDFNRNIFEHTFTTEGRVPLALRFGFRRNGRLALDGGGCIGFPWGSLLTAKMHKFCGFEFRTLQYLGVGNDPPAGTPVKMYPDCISIDDPLSPDATCMTEESTEVAR